MEIIYPRRYGEFTRDLEKLRESLRRNSFYREEYLEARRQCTNPDVHFPLTKTAFWKWKEGGCKYPPDESFFYAMPPILSARRSNRIFFAMPKRVLHSMRLHEIVEKSLGERVLRSSTGVEYINFFWESFFGQEDYIGDAGKASLPICIIASRTLSMAEALCDGEGELKIARSVTVRERLEEISEVWDTPVFFAC